MNLDMTGINHQPLIIRRIHQHVQKRLPNSFVPPATEMAMRIFPVTIVGRQPPPGLYPKYGIDELLIVARVILPHAPLRPNR
jgi:hypothetical protein